MSIKGDTCPQCQGDGKCNTCGGSGAVEDTGSIVDCPTCRGSTLCGRCSGTGRV